jgi:hypothetical protein
MASKIELTYKDIQDIQELLKNPSLPADERQLLEALVAMAKGHQTGSQGKSPTESADPGVAWIFDWVTGKPPA